MACNDLVRFPNPHYVLSSQFENLTSNDLISNEQPNDQPNDRPRLLTDPVTNLKTKSTADSRTNLITSWSTQSQITWLAGNSTRLRRIFKQIFKSVISNSSVAAAVQLVANVILCHIVKPFMSDQLPTPNFKPLSNAFNYIYNQNFTLPRENDEAIKMTIHIYNSGLSQRMFLVCL